jgi:hypothetical protein
MSVVRTTAYRKKKWKVPSAAMYTPTARKRPA